MLKWLSYQRNRTVVFFLFGITFSIYSQGNIYDELNSQYKRLIQEQKLDSALIFAKQMNSWALKNEGDTSLRYAVSFRYIGNCLQGNISDSSLIFYKKSVSILSNQGRKIHLESANGNFYIGLYYDKKGDYSNAKFYYLKSIEIKDSILGRENLDYALTLLQIANINFNLSNYNQASVQYQEILKTRIKLLGENSLKVADVLFNLGILNSKTSNNKVAISYFLKALTIRKGMLGPLDAQVVFVLYQLGENYRQIKDWNNAKKYLLDAFNLSTQIYGTNEVEYVTLIESLGLLYWDLAEYNTSEVFLRKNVEVCLKTFGVHSLEYIEAQLNLTKLKATKGDFYESMNINNILLETSKNTFGDSSIEYAKSLEEYGNLLKDLGQVKLSIEKFKLAVDILNKFPSKKFERSSVLLGLGRSYGSLYLLREADSCFQESLKLKLQIGDTLENLAALYDNQGVLLVQLGNIVAGQKRFLDALAIETRVYGKNHPKTAMIIKKIANTYSEFNDHKKAINFLSIAKEIIRNSLGEFHPEYADILVSFGNVYSRIHDLENARINYLEAISNTEKSIGLKNQVAADIYYNLGNIYFEENNFEQSKKAYLKSLEITKELNQGYNNNTSIFVQLATVSSYLNETNLFEKYTEEGLQCLKNNIATNYTWLSQNERCFFSSDHNLYFDKLNALSSTLSLQSPFFWRTLFNNNLISKSLQLETTRELDKAISNSLDKLLKEQFSEMKQLRRLVSKMQSEGSDKKEIIQRYIQQADSLDKILVNKLGEYANAKRKFEITWKDVQAGLSTKEAAIEFARFYDYKDGAYKYMALIVRPGYEYPKLVKLGSELNIKNASSQREFSDLYKFVWVGIDSLLTGVKTIYYSPVGELNNVSFSALMSETNNQSDSTKSSWSYLMDRYDLHQVTTTRYLADGTLKINDSLSLSIKLIGGVNYSDLPLTTDSVAINETTEDLALQMNLKNEVIETKSNRGGKISYLKGSEIEVKEINNTLKNKGWLTTISSGKNANEHLFKKELNLKSPGIIHISTHGFAFPEKVIKEENDFQIKETATYKVSEDPMVRCGLMFSGANITWNGDPKKMIETTGDDGILTAAEVANLDLSNTKLVVLSACETGLGKIESSEGTFGLKRGFKLAGVDQIIVSLWKVPDNESMELMTLFYSELAKSNNIDSSFSKAQKVMRNRYPFEPQKWAGFVLVR